MLFNPFPWAVYVLMVPLIIPFAVNYATMLTLFSATVDSSEQGWVMGVSVALYTWAPASCLLSGAA